MKQEHYVVIIDWSKEDDYGIEILGVAHSMEEAKQIFNANIDKERGLAEENGYTIYEESETEFDAGIAGFYITNHGRLYIQKV